MVVLEALMAVAVVDQAAVMAEEEVVQEMVMVEVVTPVEETHQDQTPMVEAMVEVVAVVPVAEVTIHLTVHQCTEDPTRNSP